MLEWESNRRAATLELFAADVYGYTPEGGAVAGFEVASRQAGALGGLATRIELAVTLSGPRGTRPVSLLVYVPSDASVARRAPVFLGLNFKGNRATTREFGGEEQRRWPYALALTRGYAVATVHYEELELDVPGAAAAGVRGLFGTEPALLERGDPEAWGAIGAWAWGLCRALDVLEACEAIDGSSVIALGHSRLGKTALWAAAQDRRFAGVISNDSGCGGASLFRHQGIEDIAVVTSARPHWFANRFASYQHAEEDLPVDQHQLLALLAPRPVHVASASRDPGADPRGEYLSTLHASPLFELFGLEGTLPSGLVPAGMDVSASTACGLADPAPGRQVGGQLSYHLRDGEHDMLVEDWTHFLSFADRNLGT